MNKFVRWYNQNRKTIWKGIGIVALIILIIQLLNYWVKRNNEKELEAANQIQVTNNLKEYNTVSVGEEYSTLTGESLSNNQLSQIEVIDMFVEYCNNGKVEEAYNMLTDECKDEIYREQRIFEETYYNEIFLNTQRNVVVENWISNIYKVNYNEDFLSSGKYSTENTKQDYITIEQQEDDTYKLNINNYIGRKELNKSHEKNEIYMEVLEKDTYMDYEIYTIKVQNNSNSTVKLDDGQNIKGMYIEDDNGSQYGAYTHELTDVDLIVSPRETKQIQIKYYSRYSSEKHVTNLGFARMNLNYQENIKPNIDSFRIEL